MTARLDPTLEELLDGLMAEAAAQADADRFAGQADKRSVWTLAGLDKQVATVAALAPLLDIVHIGSLRFVVSEERFYDLTANDEGVRSWQPVTAPDGILFEFERLHGYFSRQECETVYTNEDNNGLVMRMVAAKLQSDVIAGIERDFRYRHRTALRSRLHGAAIRRVAGDGKGTVNNIRRYLGLLLAEIEKGPLNTVGAPQEDEKTGSAGTLGTANGE